MTGGKNSMKNFDISNLIITKIRDIYSYTLPEDATANATAAHCALILKHGGRTLITAKKRTHTADASHILFLPAGVAYTMTVDRPGECTVILFDAVADTMPADVCEYDTGGEEEMLSTAKSLLYFWNLHGPAYHSKCLSELFSLITQISTLDAYANSLAGKYRLIHRSVKYIEKNYAHQDLYTPALAAMSDIGETYYRNIFHEVFGTSPNRYIQEFRVSKAKELLTTGKYSVEEIAAATGFANASYFCKVFKSVTSLTPSEFAANASLIG